MMLSDESGSLIKIIFLLGFTLHNFEEAVWLPGWSKYAKKFHKPVETNQFIFAVLFVTIFGYLLTALDIIFGSTVSLVNYIYLGFVGMMGINAIFPHLLSTIVLKRYAPGLITALLLNLPFSVFIIFQSIDRGIDPLCVLAAIILVSILAVLSLRPLFKLGAILLHVQ